MSSEATHQLTERAQHVLRVLVKQYINEGQPVGSKALALTAGLDLSPATIRNIMAELETHGFLRSPHTSAGRIPTVQGYRFFVDSLISVEPLETTIVEKLKGQLGGDPDTARLVANVSEFLSGITRYAGIVTLPRLQSLEITRIEFVPLSEQRVLVILVTGQREVQNRIIQLPRRFKADELQTIANYLNAEFVGKRITQVRRQLLVELQQTRESMDQLMRAAVEMAERLFTEPDENEGYVVKGQTNLMEFDELSNVSKLRQLFEAFNQKREILHLLDQCLNADGVQIFIGEESGYRVLDEVSVVTSTYSAGGRPLGVIGVIGPTRMPYQRVIPVVDITAKILGAALNSK